MTRFGEQMVIVALAVISVAVLAVLVSRQSDTSNVIGALGAAFSNSLGAALRPVVSPQSL